jgi:hypothetical protein
VRWRRAVRCGVGVGVALGVGEAAGGDTVVRAATPCVRSPNIPVSVVTRTAPTRSTPAADRINQRLAMSTLDLDR